MPWPPRRSSISEVQLQREVTTLQLKLLKANAALRTKTLYAERLEYLLRERLTKIDELTTTIDGLREQNRKLEAEAEHLAALVARPQLNALSPQ
jgi:hypothetical protein